MADGASARPLLKASGTTGNDPEATMKNPTLITGSLLATLFAACAPVDGDGQVETESEAIMAPVGAIDPASRGLVNVMNGGITCSGFLLDPSTVLTAGRCTTAVASNLTVSMGTEGRRVRAVHPGAMNRVMVLELQSPLNGVPSNYRRSVGFATGSSLNNTRVDCVGQGSNSFTGEFRSGVFNAALNASNSLLNLSGVYSAVFASGDDGALCTSGTSADAAAIVVNTTAPTANALALGPIRNWIDLARGSLMDQKALLFRTTRDTSRCLDQQGGVLIRAQACAQGSPLQGFYQEEIPGRTQVRLRSADNGMCLQGGYFGPVMLGNCATTPSATESFDLNYVGGADYAYTVRGAYGYCVSAASDGTVTWAGCNSSAAGQRYSLMFSTY